MHFGFTKIISMAVLLLLVAACGLTPKQTSRQRSSMSGQDEDVEEKPSISDDKIQISPKLQHSQSRAHSKS